MNQKSEDDLYQELVEAGDELGDEDVNHENRIVSNMDTLSLVTKEISHTTDQEEVLEKHSDPPACLNTPE